MGPKQSYFCCPSFARSRATASSSRRAPSLSRILLPHDNLHQGGASMFGSLVRKSRKVRQVFRMGTVTSLAFCLVVRPQAAPRTRRAQQEKGSTKTAETEPHAQAFTLVGAGDIAACGHLDRSSTPGRALIRS